jgi:hypothetical protein
LVLEQTPGKTGQSPVFPLNSKKLAKQSLAYQNLKFWNSLGYHALPAKKAGKKTAEKVYHAIPYANQAGYYSYDTNMRRHYLHLHKNNSSHNKTYSAAYAHRFQIHHVSPLVRGSSMSVLWPPLFLPLNERWSLVTPQYNTYTHK